MANTLADRIRAANSEQAWADVRADWGEARWAAKAAKVAAIRAACDKALAAAEANPQIRQLFALPGLTAEELALVDTRVQAHNG